MSIFDLSATVWLCHLWRLRLSSCAEGAVPKPAFKSFGFFFFFFFFFFFLEKERKAEKRNAGTNPLDDPLDTTKKSYKNT